MTDSQKVDAYIEKQSRWSEEMKLLREVFQKTELKEEVKWGSPTYTLNKKLVAGFAGFKNHYAIWFHQGVFLRDPHKKLVNAQEGVTRGLRQWRLTKGDPIESDILLDYLHESIENCLAGKEIKPEKKKGVVIPAAIKERFDKDSMFKEAFHRLTPGKQREYAEHISSAKREVTQLSRMDKIAPMIIEGKGLNDKYKNS